MKTVHAQYLKYSVADRLYPQRLFERGITDGEQLRFPGDRRVRYPPFVKADPDDLIVIEARIPRSFLNDDGVERVRKVRISDAARVNLKSRSRT